MTRNSRRNLPKNLPPNPLNNHKHYDDFDATAAASKSMIMTTKQQQLYENQHNDQPNSETLERGRKKKFRYFVASLGLTVAAVNCYAQATFCIAIVEMVLPADYVFKGESGGSQTVRVVASNYLAGANATTTTTTTTKQLVAQQAPIEELESLSCPVEYKYRDYYDEWRFPQANSSSSSSSSSMADLLSKAATSPASASSHVIDISNRFDWDASRQGLLLGAFAMGMAPLQVLGGRLAEIYGAKWVLLVGCLGTALTNLTIPVLAHFSYTLLVANRVVMGIAQAGMEPGLMCLMAQWLAPAETGFFISMLLFALCIGFFLGSLLSSFLLTIGLGWPLTYYVTGGLNLIMGIVWLVYASKGPEESLLISAEERAYIKHEQQQELAKSIVRNKINNDLSSIQDISSSNYSIDEQQQQQQQQADAPWMNILTTPSVWAFIICKISVRWCADVLTIELPTYLANVLHLSIKLNGILNSLSSAFFAIFSFITGYFVNELLKRTHEGAASEQERRNNNNINNKQQFSSPEAATVGRRSFMSKTTLRKLFQSVASFGSAIAIFLMTHYDCNIQLSMGMMFVLSACLMMGTGGELQIPYDMTSRYPGTLHGMACTLSVSGWLAPPLIGLILGDQPSSRHRWGIVWYLTASINFIGGLVFVLFADASPRNFDKRAPSGGKKAALLRQQQQQRPNQHPQNNGTTEAAGALDNNNGQSRAGLLHCKIGSFSGQPTCCCAQTTATMGCVVSPAPRPLASLPPSSTTAFQARPAQTTTTFDGGELLKIRQLEGSLFVSNSRLDSLLAGQLGADNVMFPYQPAATEGNGLTSKATNGSLLAWFSANTRQRRRRRRQQQQHEQQQAASSKLNGGGHLLCQGFSTSAAGPPIAAGPPTSSYSEQRASSKIITRL